MAERFLDKALVTARANPALTGFATVAAVGLGWAVNDFLQWRAFGTGGTPPTLFGYFKMTKLRINQLFSKYDPLDSSALSESGPSYLPAELPVRRDDRPHIMSRILPQRQVPDKMMCTASRLRLQHVVHDMADAHPELFEVKLSHTEGKSTDGLYARKSLKTLNPVAKDKVLDHEIAHVHPADDSLHVCLSEPDAKKVIDLAWGQRFCLENAYRGWVMLYAPRNMQEVEQVESIVKAAATFVTGVQL